MKPIRITAVSYYNTLPFIYGLTLSGRLSGFKLSLDVPSECARKIVAGEADVGLIPVGALPDVNNYKLLGNLCIGAVKDVKSVLLLSNAALPAISTIYLDTDSRTSVNLVRILAKNFWKINPHWRSVSEWNGKLDANEGIVLIGDKTFGLSSRYPFCLDLAGEWIKYTGLPFVFAVWITNTNLSADFEKSFQSALQWGVDHRENSVQVAHNLHISEQQLVSYLNNDISYTLDEHKMKGMELFLKLTSEY